MSLSQPLRKDGQYTQNETNPKEASVDDRDQLDILGNRTTTFLLARRCRHRCARHRFSSRSPFSTMDSVTTTASPSTSLPSFSSKQELRPNPHPYAIKTTSSALLSRSNSSPHAPQPVRHHYVPLSPTRPKANESNGNPDGRRHRYSKSLSSDFSFPTGNNSPAPLPAPPSIRSSSPTRSSWTNTTTWAAGGPTGDAFSAAGIEGDDLPSNPKLWSPTQLSAYLITALRASAVSDSDAVVQDPDFDATNDTAGEAGDTGISPTDASEIAAFVRDQKVTGRVFLRFTEVDLERCAAVSNCPSQISTEKTLTYFSNRSFDIPQKWRSALLISSRHLRQNVLRGRIWVDSSSPQNTLPFSSELYNSSTSSVDLSAPPAPTTRQQRDLARIRRKAGRVRGMVESWERSSVSSCGSVSGSDAEEEIESSRVTASPFNDSSDLPAPDSFLSQDEKPNHAAVIADEPSIEDLLRSPPSNDSDIKGARAWEADVGMGDTVKRVDGSQSPHKKELSFGRGSGKGKGTGDRRIVTAIFRGPNPNAVSEEVNTPSDVMFSALESTSRSNAQTIEPDSLPSYSDIATLDATAAEARDSKPDEHQISALATEINTTRGLIDDFRTRLEAVERQIQDLETQSAKREEALRLEAEASKQSSSSEQQVQTDSLPSPPTGIEAFFSLCRPTALIARALSYVYPLPHPAILSAPRSDSRSRSLHRSSSRRHRGYTEPSTVSALPSYVLFVSLGVCAVVLRVVLKRIGAKRVLKS
ncbi:hypothetical protein SERLA73DRAFT_73869 [Serpula lacrymans var. lacrymans S7.3]|uniref:Uncharacterized protein n=1 Tax=Serpula lacrymans var. lacrymans (strain S7.3) TaxID=936435 RepID=F8PX10_SERL3|nr:hypothetical protein SERLA73DRAFT_73869 [Serpula lacrymans var. lacrymans S7.3]